MYSFGILVLNIYNKLIDKHTENVNIYEKINETLITKFKDYKTDKIKENLENEKKKKENMHMNKTKDDKKFKYITNDIMEDISKFYYEIYNIKSDKSDKCDKSDKSQSKANKNVIDSDDIRLNWIMKRFDNGSFFFKTLFMNYLKMYKESHNIENLETEIAILKEKYEMANINMQNTTNTLNNNCTTN